MDRIGLRLLHAPAIIGASGELTPDLLRTLVSLRHFGLKAAGGLPQRLESGGSRQQQRAYVNPAPNEQSELSDDFDEGHEPRPFRPAGAGDSAQVCSAWVLLPPHLTASARAYTSHRVLSTHRTTPV